MEFQIGEFSEEHQKYETQQKHTHIHHTHANTQNRKDSPSYTSYLKKHICHMKYLFALKGVLIFC